MQFPHLQDVRTLQYHFRSILYNVEDNGFRLSSFGRDGVSGGIGLDTDWSDGSACEDMITDRTCLKSVFR